MKNNKGFTLTEILIVVVVLGVLAAFVLPRFFGQEEKGSVAEAIANLSAIRQAEASYFLENSSTYTTSMASLDIDDPNAPASRKFNYTVVITAGSPPTYKATAQRIATAPDDFKNKTIILNSDGTWDPTASHPFKPK